MRRSPLNFFDNWQMRRYLLQKHFLLWKISNTDLFNARHFWPLCEFHVNFQYPTALKHASLACPFYAGAPGDLESEDADIFKLAAYGLLANRKLKNKNGKDSWQREGGGERKRVSVAALTGFLPCGTQDPGPLGEEELLPTLPRALPLLQSLG